MNLAFNVNGFTVTHFVDTLLLFITKEPIKAQRILPENYQMVTKIL
jgi:hypothetical protein